MNTKTKIILTVGSALLLVELVILVLFLMRRDAQPAATTTNATTQTTLATAAQTEPTEEIVWDIIPDLGPDISGANVPRNPYGSEDFGYGADGYMTCFAEPCMLGIDVSSYQGDIDWQQVKDAGITFAMIRVGGRGYGQAGNFFIDQKAQQYYAGAKAAGLQVGAYFFSQALSVEEALEEAKLALELTKDWEMELPLAYDWEFVNDDGRTAVADMYTVAMCTRAFCDAVQEGGRDAMVYVSLWFGYPYFEEFVQYPTWLALYTDEMDYAYEFQMWQYTASGRVPGISGDVDMNIYFPPK